MSLFSLGVIAVGACIVYTAIDSRKEAAAEKERKSTKFILPEFLSEGEFEDIARNAAKRIKRIKYVFIDGATVECSVVSMSKITSWSFTLDFNDYGKLTGKYWTFSENEDSKIPKAVADIMVEEFKKRGINDECYKKKGINDERDKKKRPLYKKLFK